MSSVLFVFGRGLPKSHFFVAAIASRFVLAQPSFVV
jgi:hypothetical protein